MRAPYYLTIPHDNPYDMRYAGTCDAYNTIASILYFRNLEKNFSDVVVETSFSKF